MFLHVAQVKKPTPMRESLANCVPFAHGHECFYPCTVQICCKMSDTNHKHLATAQSTHILHVGFLAQCTSRKKTNQL